MPPPRHTVAASAAHDVRCAGYEFTRMKIVNVGADLDDFADEFMPDHHRHRDGALSPIVPVEDMNIGPADAGSQNPNQDIINSDAGLGNILKPQTWFCLRFDESFQFVT